MKLLKWILKPTTSKTVIAAGITTAAVSVAIGETETDEAVAFAEKVAPIALIATFLYGSFSTQPSRGKVRATTSGVLAATAAGAAAFACLAIAATSD